MIAPIFLFLAGAVLLSSEACSQHVVRSTYYNGTPEQLKTYYDVIDTIQNVAHGKYISYFRNGNVQSKGNFDHNRPIGKWEFFYKSGELKMISFPLEGSGDRVRKIYYYRNGQKSIEGEMRGNRREGLWKLYTEQGVLKSEVTYDGVMGRCNEYYPSGGISGEGFYRATEKAGAWRYFNEDKKLISEGSYERGKKEGLWKYYSSSGALIASGSYKNGEKESSWQYFFENGAIHLKGNYSQGRKYGKWQTFDADGNLESLKSFKPREKEEVIMYYPTGEVEAMGKVEQGKNQGEWLYFYRNGKKKGSCDFDRGSGTYFGYSPDGRLQGKGYFKDNLRVGVWEVYDKKDIPAKKDTVSSVDRTSLPDKSSPKEEEDAEKKTASKTTDETSTNRIRGRYFSFRPSEYKGLIFGINPFFSLIGRVPVALELYHEGKMGYEFLFHVIRDPFFKPIDLIKSNEVFIRGYDIALRQKFYNPFKLGLWYFGHTIVFTSRSHTTLMDINSQSLKTSLMVSASEIKIEYGVLLGVRLMRNVGRNGLTLDTYVGCTAGYRGFTTLPAYKDIFASLQRDPFAYTFRFGINFGYALSVKRR